MHFYIDSQYSQFILSVTKKKLFAEQRVVLFFTVKLLTEIPTKVKTTLKCHINFLSSSDFFHHLFPTIHKILEETGKGNAAFIY